MLFGLPCKNTFFICSHVVGLVACERVIIKRWQPHREIGNIKTNIFFLCKLHSAPRWAAETCDFIICRRCNGRDPTNCKIHFVFISPFCFDLEIGNSSKTFKLPFEMKNDAVMNARRESKLFAHLRCNDKCVYNHFNFDMSAWKRRSRRGEKCAETKRRELRARCLLHLLSRLRE